jgi:hypothetical protein
MGDSPKVKVWLGMTKSKIYGPFFFNEAMVKGSVYLDMLEQFFKTAFSTLLSFNKMEHHVITQALFRPISMMFFQWVW